MNRTWTKENIENYLDSYVPNWARGIVEFFWNKKWVLEFNRQYWLWIEDAYGLDNIPSTWSLVVASDHYRGMIDGLIHAKQGTLTMFPTGRSVVDAPWKRRFLRIAQEHEASIVPASIYGSEPSRLFKLAHQISYYIDQRLWEDRRSAAVLNPWELIKPNRRYSAIYWKAISPESLDRYTPSHIRQEVRKLTDMII